MTQRRASMASIMSLLEDVLLVVALVVTLVAIGS
jgi:hypothetical protein